MVDGVLAMQGARPVARAVAIANAVRKPRRTATTASALMIGLALVAFFFILGDSIKASVSGSIEEGLRADYVISVDGFAGGFSPALAEDLKAQWGIGLQGSSGAEEKRNG